MSSVPGRKRFSVVVSCYNDRRRIGRCLEAILGQTRRPDEVVVVDDGSTDGSDEVIARYAGDPAVQVLRNETNQGVESAALRGFRHASGDYVMQAGSDDVLLPGFADRCLHLLEAYPEAGMCCTDALLVDDTGEVLKVHRPALADRPTYLSPGEVVSSLRRSDGGLTAVMVLFRSDRVRFDPEVFRTLRWHADGFYCFTTAFRYGMCYVPEPLVRITVRSDSYSGTGSRDRQAQREALTRYLELLDSPEFRDVRPAFQRTGVLACAHREILPLILSLGRFDYLSWPLLRRTLGEYLLRFLAPLAPRPLKRLYRRLRVRGCGRCLPGPGGGS